MIDFLLILLTIARRFAELRLQWILIDVFYIVKLLMRICFNNIFYDYVVCRREPNKQIDIIIMERDIHTDRQTNTGKQTDGQADRKRDCRTDR